MTPLHQELASIAWTVRAVGDTSRVPSAVATRVVSATVPGCIHTDLMDAGLIRDPRIGDAESEVQWVSWTDWRYEAEFEADAALFERDEIDLVFDALDTIAMIEVNGVEVGRAASEFLPHRFSVRDVVRPGTNRVAVTFTSPLRYVQEESARLGPRPVNGDYPAYNMIRKCASNFEWDWGPRVATCGISAGVRLQGWSVGRIDAVVPEWAQAGALRVSVAVHLAANSAPVELSASLLLPSALIDRAEHRTTLRRVSERRAECSLVIDVSDPERWSPTGHGSQAQFGLHLSLHWAEQVVDTWKHTIGFRTTDLEQSDGACTLFVNKEPIYCRGVNWIPEGLFPRDRTPERVRQRLMQLKAANMNMIRVWGGGRYEPDWFYDICDKLGILVWQDFMFACACYPEEEPIRSLVDAEARYHVARLSRHPSVVLWCGGNECTWAHQSWGFKEKLAPGQTWGEKYYNEILRNACREVNPSVPYIPNSPFSPTAGVHPNDPAQGDSHTWEVWGDGYRTVTPRFCSEFGQQGPSNIRTLESAQLLTPAADALVPPLLTTRQRGPGGNKRWYDDPIATWFRPPRNFDEWHYLAQLLQARSLQIGIEWQRANMPRCMGSLIWQLNDAWPGLSWSLIDTEGMPKPAYGSVQDAFRDRLLTIQPFDGRPWLVGVNDSGSFWEAPLVVRRLSFDGASLAENTGTTLLIAPRTAQRIAPIDRMVGSPKTPQNELVVADSELSSPAHCRAQWFYLPDRELEYPPASFEWSVDNCGPATCAEIRTQSLIRDAVIRIERAPGVWYTARPLRTLLLPGESCDLFLACPRGWEPKDHNRPVSIRCANHFGKPSS